MNFKSILIKDTSKKKKFWKTERTFEDFLRNRFKQPAKISLKGVFKKHSKNQQTFDSFKFFIVGSYFGYHKVNSREVKYFDLTTAVLKSYVPENSSSSYGFTLIRYSTQSKDFVMENKAAFEKWWSRLKLFCVQTDFSASYELASQVGKGNFATVHKVKSKKDGKYYAAKVIAVEGLTKSMKLRQAVRTELAVNRKMRFPTILKYFEVYEDEQKIYMIFELLEGGELFDRVLKRKRYSEREAAIVMKQLLEALQFLEEKGIVHRDLKLENILLVSEEDDCLIRVADFGLATFLEVLDPKVRCGTPGYVAPEIIAGEMYDCRSDMFAAGAVLYILLSGCTPFPGKTFEEIMSRNRKCSPKFNSPYWANVSFEAIDFVVKMMTADHRKRLSPKEALESPWMKKMLEATRLPSRYNLEHHNSIEYLEKETMKSDPQLKALESNTERRRSKKVVIEDEAPSPEGGNQRIELNLKKKLSLNLYSNRSQTKTFQKMMSMSPEGKDVASSMHKKVMQRNFLKKMKTLDPNLENEEMTEADYMRQSTGQSRFDLKSGLLLNSFYAKGASQGTSSETDEGTIKKNMLTASADPLEKPLRQSGFGRMYSMKGTSVAALNPEETDWNSMMIDDQVPDEISIGQDVMGNLKTFCFLAKPQFQNYETGDSEIGHSEISHFPNFKNAFVEPSSSKKLGVS